MYQDLTQGNITKTMIYFALPMILGNLLQQFYNVADTLIVGRFLGRDAGRWIGLHPHDLSHVHPPGAFHGGGRAIFHLPGTL